MINLCLIVIYYDEGQDLCSIDNISWYMLTPNRRDYLKSRSSQKDKAKKAEYDYRILKWLETLLDSGPEGGIGDINRVLDTLDGEAIRKHLEDKNIDDLLKLLVRLLDVMDFVPLGIAKKEMEYQGKKVKTNVHYADKSIMVAPPGGGGEVSILGATREATKDDIKRHKMLTEHVGQIKYFIEPGTHMPEIRSAEYFKDQIADAHERGLIALAYDIRQPTYEENLLSAIETAQRLGDYGTTEEERKQITELKEKVTKQQLEIKEEPPK